MEHTNTQKGRKDRSCRTQATTQATTASTKRRNPRVLGSEHEFALGAHERTSECHERCIGGLVAHKRTLGCVGRGTRGSAIGRILEIRKCFFHNSGSPSPSPRIAQQGAQGNSSNECLQMRWEKKKRLPHKTLQGNHTCEIESKHARPEMNLMCFLSTDRA